MTQPAITIGLATDQEMPFVLDTWARSFRKAPRNRRMPTKAFHAWNRPRMQKALRNAHVLVARDPDNQTFIYGWIAVEFRADQAGDLFVTHYCYVRQPFQRQGVATRLLTRAIQTIADPECEPVYTHQSVKFVDEYMQRCGFSCRPGLIDGPGNRSADS